VLATSGEAKNRRGVGDQSDDPSLDAFAVDEFGGATVGGANRVGGVGFVDELASAGVGFHIEVRAETVAWSAASGWFFTMFPPQNCQRCGVCCFSKLETYIRVTGNDWSRLGGEAEGVAHFIGHRAYMKMERGRCAALAVREDGEGRREFFCTVYAMRPQTCRDLGRGSPECAGEIELKGDRPGIEVF
jgi:hypothetical protein